MKKGFRKQKQLIQIMLAAFLVIGSATWFVSCEDDYTYDDVEPEWLGASIYDYLESDGNYTIYTKLIDDIGYKPVLAKTGSKTLFVASDSAFDVFFQDNPWDVKSYEDLSLAQKKTILNFTMINNAYLIETLANYYFGSLQEGTALRRETAISVIDSIPFERGDDLPNTKYWDRFKAKGINILKDASSWPMLHFLPSTLQNAGISNEDFELISGVSRESGDAHIFNIKIIKKDITCKNGYIHVLENVLIPRTNVAEHIYQNPNTSTFSTLLERFSAPYYSAEQTEEYKESKMYEKHPIDSIYEKVYFSEIDGAVRYPSGEVIPAGLRLPFNPGRNTYAAYEGAMQPDMAAILCPTDQVMDEYFNSGAGAVLKERYGTWENVPDDKIMPLLQRQMRSSFLESVPSMFENMVDENNSEIPIDRSNITGSYLGLNGVVYYVNEVFSPDIYISVYAPAFFSARTKVFNWAVEQNQFELYLNALESRYSFFIPTDEYFENYIDPIAYAKDVKAAMKYSWDEEEQAVYATVHSFNPETNEIGDSIYAVTNESFVRERLLDLLNNHVVVNGVEHGDGYYFSKGGNTLKVTGSGEDLQIQGGYDIQKDVHASVVPNGLFDQYNGHAYFIDKPIQTPLKSVYKVLSETPEFEEFFKLMYGFIEEGSSSHKIFVKETNNYGIDYNIRFFNTYNYTIYIPSNEAVETAVTDSVISDWDYIATLSGDEKEAEITKLERFIRYHFQDNSVFIGNTVTPKGQAPAVQLYQTSTIKLNDTITNFNTYKNKAFKLKVTNDGSSLSIETENGTTAQVITDNENTYNIMTRDYIFSDNPQEFKEADGTGTGDNFSTSLITTSSNAVIHQIDHVLTFE